MISEFIGSPAAVGKLSSGLWLCISLVGTHVGLGLLVALASGWPRQRRERAPEIDRSPVEPLARAYIYYFALTPAVAAVALAFAGGRLGPLASLAPLVLLSGLAVVVAAGNQVLLYRERLVSSAWLGLLVAPPLLVAFSLVVVPWTVATDLRIAQPARTEARFFADNFQHRTGKPLAFVTGDERIAPLIALAAPSRPHVYFAWAPQRSPWTSAADVAAQGGVLVWPAAGNSGTPPATLRAQFPAIVPEVPRSFARAVQGRLPLIRLGWAVLKPQPGP
jgi:hypothetical protein